MFEITSLFAENYVVFDKAQLPIVPGLTVLRGRNEDRKSSSLHSTNAVGKSLLVSALPECLYDAAPLQKAAGRGDVKVQKMGSLGFEARVGKDSVRVVKRGSGSSFKTDLYLNGSDTPETHRKSEALAKLQELFPVKDKLYYTTAHLTNRMPGFGTSSPEDRFALFSSFLNADTVAALIQKITQRHTHLSKIKDKADAATSVLAALPHLKPQRAFERFALVRALDKAKKQVSARDDALARSLYESLPQALQNKYPYEELLQETRRAALKAALEKRIAQKHKEDAAVDTRKTLQKKLDDLDDRIESATDILSNADFMTEALWSDIESGFNGKHTANFLSKVLHPLRDAWDAHKDIFESLPPMPTAADVSRETVAREALTEAGLNPASPTLDADILQHLLATRPKQCAFLSRLLSNEVSFLSQSKKEREACFELFGLLTSLLTHAQRVTDAEALFKGGLTALQKAHTKKDALDTKLRKAEDFYVATTQASALFRMRAQLQEKLEALPAATAGSIEAYQSALRLLTKFEAASPSAQHHKEGEDAQRRYDAAHRALALFDAHREEAARATATRRALQRDVAAFEKVREEFEDLTLLKSSFAAKGFKAALLSSVIEMYERNLNAVAHLLFEEETTFTCRAEGSSFFIIARRPKVPPCDVRKLSGSESVAFALCNVLALLPLLPSKSKTNVLILDEMEEPMDAAMRERFVTLYLPHALTVIPSIVCITTKTPDVFSFGALPQQEFLLTRRGSKTTLVAKK